MKRVAVTAVIWAGIVIAAVASGELDGAGVGESILGAVIVFGIVFWIVSAAAYEAARKPGEKPAFGTRHTGITGRTRCVWCHKGVRVGASVCHHCGRDQPA